MNQSPPIQPDQEWANALTHGLSAALWVALGGWLLSQTWQIGPEITVACAAYLLSVIGTFVCSTLSHVYLTQPHLDRFRAWDQAIIYLMIVGTYTPIAVRHAPEAIRDPLLVAMWAAAMAGFANKVVRKHRIHRISTWTYLLLGWLPAIPLYREVPTQLGLMMLGGGVVYSLGVIFLVNDRNVRYFHAVWHVMVLAASLVHFAGILFYVVQY